MKFRKFILFILASCTIFSCSNELSNTEMDPLKSYKNLDYYVEDGILNIRNNDVFEKLLVENSKKTKEELVEWQDSVGFECFQSYYNTIFEEYEQIIGAENPIANLEKYKYDYKDYIEMPGGMIDGLPNYCISPRLDMIYATVANVNGLVIIEGKTIDAKDIIKLKSAYNCYKNTSDRRMWVEVYITTSTGNILSVYVTQQKKIVFAWASYQTSYSWQLETPAITTWYTPNDVPTGTIITMPLPNGTNYLKMWNRGVGESNACTFTLPITF